MGFECDGSTDSRDGTGVRLAWRAARSANTSLRSDTMLMASSSSATESKRIVELLGRRRERPPKVPNPLPARILDMLTSDASSRTLVSVWLRARPREAEAGMNGDAARDARGVFSRHGLQASGAPLRVRRRSGVALAPAAEPNSSAPKSILEERASDPRGRRVVRGDDAPSSDFGGSR